MAIIRGVGMLPTSDLERAKSWYEEKIGLTPVEEVEDQGAYYEVGETRFFLYPSQFAGTNEATAFAFEVDDVEATVRELSANGVEFIEYDYPEFKTVGGVATFEVAGRTMKSAWCTDSEGNILVIGNAWRD